MKEKNEKYLVTMDKSLAPDLSLGQALRETMFITKNFKKAYHMGLELAEIKEPHIGYKAALNQVNKTCATTIKEKLGQNKMTIVRLKSY